MSQSIRFENEKAILLWSGTKVAHGTLPNRIVMWNDGRQFIVHVETLAVRVEGGTVVFSHASYGTGDYFRYDQEGRPRDVALEEARKRFNERAAAF